MIDEYWSLLDLDQIQVIRPLRNQSAM